MGYYCGCGCSGCGGGRCDGDGCRCSSCTCCDMSGLGIIDGMGMTCYRMTTSSSSGTVDINRGNPSSPSPGTGNDCKPHSSHCRTTTIFCVHFL
ncbi:hypothetical protein M0802_008638 [Mischocyttarus mexicanus]|nr:hypothetical protein M0802_008638 [Mischocyttarus mexicanus]